MVSTGGHRDDFYRVEKDFKILTGLAIATSLIVAICGILIYVYKDEALQFDHLPEYSDNEHAKVVQAFINNNRDTTPGTLTKTKEKNVGIYQLYLLIVDIAGLILCVINVVVVIGCNKRERYDVESAVERAMLSRQASRARLASSSRSSSRHTLRS